MANKPTPTVDPGLEGVAPIKPKMGSGAISGQTGVKLEPGENLGDFLQKKDEEQKQKAKYKIEVIFSRHRSSLAHKPSPCMIIMWESGKRFHGGGDQKMYWCGYPNCDKPISSDHFAYMHVVCPHCQREQWLDPDSKESHIKAAQRDGNDTAGLRRMPFVVGERLANLTPPKLADLLVITWRKLDSDADVYLKYSPYEIRYDIKQETTKDIDNLDKVRVQRQPVIYTLKSILKDIGAGADLHKRFLGLITS
jgi:hypothetical protein